MAKNSFILYHDQKEVIDELSDEDAGKLFKAIFDYNVNKEIKLTGMLKLIFIPFKTSFDRDFEKWDEIKEKRSNAGKNHTGNQYTRKKENGTNGTSVPTDESPCYTSEKNDLDEKKMEQMEQNGTNGTVNVSVSVNGSVNVNDSVSVNNIPPHHTDDVFHLAVANFGECEEMSLRKSCDKFFKYYEKKEWQGVKNWEERLKMWIDDDISQGKIKVRENIDDRIKRIFGDN